MSERVCEYRFCDVSIDGRRPQCRFCTPKHKAAEHREKEAERLGSRDTLGKTVHTVSRPLRRANRDGVGTRLYVTPRDLEALDWLATYGPDALSDSQLEPLRRKLDHASERVARKETK